LAGISVGVEIGDNSICRLTVFFSNLEENFLAIRIIFLTLVGVYCEFCRNSPYTKFISASSGREQALY